MQIVLDWYLEVGTWRFELDIWTRTAGVQSCIAALKALLRVWKVNFGPLL